MLGFEHLAPSVTCGDKAIKCWNNKYFKMSNSLCDKKSRIYLAGGGWEDISGLERTPLPKLKAVLAYHFFKTTAA